MTEPLQHPSSHLAPPLLKSIPPLAAPRNPDIIGAPIDRTDGRLKVTGGARYSAEINLPGLTYGVIITSTIANGTVAGMDTAEAERAPGVLAVFTPFNMPKLPKQPDDGRRGQPVPRATSPLLQDNEVHYFLQPIGVVVADTLERATHAARPRQGEIRRGQTRRRAGRASARSLRPRDQRQQQGTRRHLRKRPRRRAQLRARAHRAGLPDAHRKPQPDGAARHHRRVGRRPPDALRRHAGHLHDPQPGRRAVRPARRQRARHLPLRRRRLRLARGRCGRTRCSRPCARRRSSGPSRSRWNARRCSTTPAAARTPTRAFAAGADKDGKLAAVKHDATNNTSTFDEFTEPATVATRMLYACDDIQTTQRLVRLNLGTPSYMRAPGEAPGTFALESGMDELAARTEDGPHRVAPEELRRDRPGKEDALFQQEPAPMLRAGRGEIRLGQVSRPAPSRAACATANGSSATAWRRRPIPPTAAPPTPRACLNADGTALVHAGSQDLGTGTWTVMTQISAGTLGLPMDKVRFELGDTVLPEDAGLRRLADGGQHGQRGAGGVRGGARASSCDLAVADEKSPLHGASAQDVSSADGRLSLKSDPSKGESLRRVADAREAAADRGQGRRRARQAGKEGIRDARVRRAVLRGARQRGHGRGARGALGRRVRHRQAAQREDGRPARSKAASFSASAWA